MANEIQVSVGVSTKAAENAIKKFDRKVDSATVNIKNSFSKLDGAIASFAGNLGANVVTSAANGLVNTFKSAVDTIVSKAIDLERTRAQFKVLTGSVQEANSVIRNLQEFSATTPFQFQGISQAAQRLFAFGTTADELIPRLRILGDVSAGSGKDIRELATIFGQVQQQGKLTLERFNQITEVGVPLGDNLAKVASVALPSLRDEISKGNVSFKEFEQALKDLTGEGGLFFEATIAQSKTLGGVLSTLSDNITFVAKDIGAQFLPTFKAVTTSVLQFIQTNRELIAQLGTNIFSGILKAISLLVDGLVEIDRGFQAFRVLGNEVELGLISLAQKTTEFQIKIVSLLDSVAGFLGLDFSSLDNFKKGLQDSIVELENSKAAINNETSAIVENFNKREEALNNFSEAFKVSKEEEARFTEEANARKVQSEAQTTDAITAERKRLIEQTKALEEEETTRKDELRLLAQERKQLEADEDFKFLQERLGTEEALRQTARIQAQKNEDKANQLRIKARTKAIDAEIKQESKKTDFLKLTFSEQVSAAQNTANLLVGLAQSSSQRQGGIFKAAATAQAIISGIAAVQQALNAPFPLNIANAAIVSATTAANVARIKSAPAFQDGGIVPGNQTSGDNVLARVNSQEMILNREQQGNLFNAINTGEIGGSTNITIQGNVIADDESQVNDLISKIKDQIEFRNVEFV